MFAAQPLIANWVARRPLWPTWRRQYTWPMHCRRWMGGVPRLPGAHWRSRQAAEIGAPASRTMQLLAACLLHDPHRP